MRNFNFIVLLTVVFGLQAHGVKIVSSRVGEGFTSPPTPLSNLERGSNLCENCREGTSLPSQGRDKGWGQNGNLYLYRQQESLPVALLLSREDSETPSAQTIYQVSTNGEVEPLVMLEDHIFNHLDGDWILLDDGLLGINLMSDTREIEAIDAGTSDNLLTEVQQILGDDDFTPMFGPVLVDDGLMLMAGAGDPAVNLYLMRDDDLIQLTDARATFPEAPEPLLSASVAFIAGRPGHDGFLYRARVRDAEGTDHNALFWHDLNESHPMPFFGKDPVWSVDGLQLVGSRVRTLDDGTPLYGLWLVDIASGDETFIADACNPQFSPDGVWLAYDLHENATWTAYTDCFASGQVEALNLETGERVLLSDGLPDFVTLMGWVSE